MPGHHLNKLFEQRDERVRQQSVTARPANVRETFRRYWLMVGKFDAWAAVRTDGPF